MATGLGLLEASAVGGICIVLFFAVSQFLGVRYRAGYRKVIWLLIALRMCVPLSISSLPRPITVPVPVYVLGDVGEGESYGAGNAGGGNPAEAAAGSAAGDDGAAGASASVPAGIRNGGGRLTSWHILAAVWAAGCGAMLVYYLAAYFLFRHGMMKRSRECTDKCILAALTRIGWGMGLNRLPELRIVSEAGTGPFTAGIFHNMIFLPDREYREKDLQYILRHELTHCAGRDTQVKLLFVLVNAVHWFNPLAWLMRVMVNQDLELACDEKVLAECSGKERSEYGELLMSCIQRGGAGGQAFSTGYIQGVRFIKRRFGNIFHTQKKSGKAAGCCMAVLLAAVSAGIGFQAGRTVYAHSGITIETGTQLQVDVTGDGQPDRIRVFDNNDALRTSVGLTDASGIEAWFEYEEDVWASSTLTAGDLSGNGAADIVLMRYSNGMHGTGFPSVLYVEEESGGYAWREYPRVFLANPAIDKEQPETFDDIECRGATVIEKEGRHCLRLLAMDMEYFAETGDDLQELYIDCSWQGNGWLIEDMGDGGWRG